LIVNGHIKINLLFYVKIKFDKLKNKNFLLEGDNPANEGKINTIQQ